MGRLTWRVRTGSLFVVLALLLGACGSSAERTPVTLRVVMADDWADTDAILDAVRDFERIHDDVQVEMRGMPFSQIPAAVRAGEEAQRPFDVAHWHAFAAGAQELALPLDDIWREQMDPATFVPGAVADVTWAGSRYGVPLDVNVLLLISNRDLLEEHGVSEPPGTFDEVRDAARAVTSDDGEIRGLAIAHSSWSTYGWIRAASGDLFEGGREAESSIELDDARTVEALGFLADLVRSGVAFPPSARNTSGDAFTIFRSGKAAMHLAGTWDAVALDEADLAWDHDVSPMPSIPDVPGTGTALGGSSLFVPSGSSNRQLAVTFMRHLVSDEYALRYAAEEGRLPARRAVYDRPMFDGPVFDVVRYELDRASPMKLIAFPEADRIFSEAIDGILTGRVAAADALRQAQERIDRTRSGGGTP